MSGSAYTYRKKYFILVTVNPDMSNQILRITGGKPLRGSVRIGGAKNASYKIMIASLLAESESRLLNFSHISDVESVAKLCAYLGATVTRAGERALFIDPQPISKSSLPHEVGAAGRFSSMFAPVLLHHTGRAEVPLPGGDKIGKRPLDRHLAGLESLGASIQVSDHTLKLTAPNGLTGADFTFSKNSHTGTETMIMAAVLAKGTTILRNAALEPEVDDLILFLNTCGAKIERRLNRVIQITGVDRLHGSIHKIMPDRNEAVSYACAALATKGDIIIENARAQDLTAFLETIDDMGAGYEQGSYGLRIFYFQPLQSVEVTTQPEPGFMTDWQPLMATLLTQAHGTSTIHETVMQKRFQYVPDLQAMGANITSFQPSVEHPDLTYNFNLDDDEGNDHAISITGPTKLKAGSFATRDLRHGATLAIAALAAEGESYITGVDHIDRGYEKLAQRLATMGGNISRTKQT